MQHDLIFWWRVKRDVFLIFTWTCLVQTGGLDSLVNVWHLNVESLENVYQLNNNELHSTMHGHTGAITCLAIASNGLFAVSGSEDKLVLVWGLTVGSAVFTFSVSYLSQDQDKCIKCPPTVWKCHGIFHWNISCDILFLLMYGCVKK